MTTATLTSKGQITIPKQVRQSLNLHTGDSIQFVVHGREASITPISKSVDDLFGMLHDPDQKAVTVEEMDEAIAKQMRAQAV